MNKTNKRSAHQVASTSGSDKPVIKPAVSGSYLVGGMGVVASDRKKPTPGVEVGVVEVCGSWEK